MALSNNMVTQYYSILSTIIDEGIESTNARTGSKVLTAPSPLFLKLDLRDGLIPLPGNRTIFPKVGATEVAWQFLGTKDPSFIMKHAPKVWGKFIEDGVLKSAYGYRWMHQFGRDQIDLAMTALMEDDTNRQVYVSTWDPSTDGLGEKHQPANVPCIVGFTLTKIGTNLNMAVNMRSSDAYVGLPYDVVTYALMLNTFATTLGIDTGFLTFQLANCHIYASDWDNATTELEDIFSWVFNVQHIDMPNWHMQQIKDNPEGYVKHFKDIKIDNFNHTKPEVTV